MIVDAHNDLLAELVHRRAEERPFARHWLPLLEQGDVGIQVCPIYTADAASLGMQLTRLMDRRAAGDPLLVCTGSDMVLFAGSGRAPLVESFRRTTRGFIELGAISHLPLAVAWLARMEARPSMKATTWERVSEMANAA